MKTTGIEQSDTPSSLGVMLLDDNTERAAMVEQSLLQNGFRVLAMLTSANGLLNQIERHRPDVIVIDLESPDRDVLESLAILSEHNPMPIVMFSQHSDPDFMSEAVLAGVTAYQGRELHPDMVKPIIEVAMSQFCSFNLLRTQLAQTRNELEEARLVERAKARLASHRGIDSNSAYQLMRKLSMDNNKRMTAVAETILATLREPGPDPASRDNEN
jgi:response regulator NasT